MSYVIILSFDAVALQGTAKKCAKMKNACEEASFSLIKPFVLCCSRCRRRHGFAGYLLELQEHINLMAKVR